MDTGFLAVVAVSLCLLSVMVAARMAASGSPARRIALAVAELWVAFGLWIAVFRALSSALGGPAGMGAGGEASDLLSRFAALGGAAQAWAIAGVVASVAVLGHLLWTFRRATSGSVRP